MFFILHAIYISARRKQEIHAFQCFLYDAIVSNL